MDIVDLLYSTMRLNINSNFRTIRINTVHVVVILNAGIWVRESELVTEKQRARERQRETEIKETPRNKICTV